MNVVTLLQPQQVVFGNGCAAQCVDWIEWLGLKRLLLVSTRSVLGQITFLTDGLAPGNTLLIKAPPIAPEPTCRVFNATLEVAQKENVDGVIAIGGGSALDVGKLVAALARGTQRVEDVYGIGLLKGRALPLACLPTTAGTGSEVSPNAVLLDESEPAKKAVISRHLVPDAAFIDPLLTVSTPAAVTAATGLDALTHCIEAYANKNAHPLVDVYAREGIALISKWLARAVENGADVEARAQLALGSFYGGLCLGPVNTAAVHALSYPLGSRFGVAHGVANAVLLPHVLRFNAAVVPQRYAEVAVALGVERNGSASATAAKGIEKIAALSAACGVPQRLSELNIPREAIPTMAKAAIQVTRLLKNNLCPVSEADAVAIYQATY